MVATPSELVILRVVLEHDGLWNWYQVGRRVFSLFAPDEIELKSLIEAGYVSELSVAGEPLPRLSVKEAGRKVLEAARQGGG